MSIEFTQYLLPDGRQKKVLIARHPDIEEIANKLIDMGCHFDIEILTTGVISMTCEQDEVLLGIQLCPNDNTVPGCVDKLILEAEQSFKALLAKEND